MKNLLKNFAGALAGILFAATAAYAISGGPKYPPAKADLIGLFGGVLVPKSSPSPSPTATVSPAPPPTPTPTVAPNDSRNSLGVFSFTVSPLSVESTGNFILFSQGRVFPGIVRGVADSTRAKLTAILEGSVTFTPSPSPPPATAPTPVKENVNGTMNARAVPITDTRFPSSGVQLRGRAMLNFDVGETDANNEPVIFRTELFRVRGFKQASPAPIASITPTP